MNDMLKEALQNGMANPSMKKIWMLRWGFSFVVFFIFLMMVIGISMLRLLSDLSMIFLFYIVFPIILGLIFAYIWAHLYWKNYRFDIGEEKIVITRGVIGKRITNIPYERVQNVNIWRGVLERFFNLYVIQIETAGTFSAGGTGGYGTTMTAEGSIQGVERPEPIVEYILAKAKGGESGLGDKKIDTELGNKEKLRLLEERLIKGEISEETYRELKKKYE